MKRFTIFISALLFTFFSYSQALSPELISSAAATLSNTQYSFDWSLGETITETLTSGTHSLTQGFHQPDFFLITIQELPDFNIRIYPNPASALIYIQTSVDKELKASLFDLNGKILEEIQFNHSIELNISQLARSVYLLKITDTENKTIKLSRIIKIH